MTKPGKSGPASLRLKSKASALNFTKLMLKEKALSRAISRGPADHFGANPSHRPWTSARARPRRRIITLPETKNTRAFGHTFIWLNQYPFRSCC